MKVLKIIKNVIITIVLVIFFAFTISMTLLLLNYNKYGVTQFEDISILLIKNGFSSETYKKDSLVLVESKPVKDYKIGEEAFVYHLDGVGGVNIEVGVIGKIYEEDNSITFTNGGTYSKEFIIGVGTKVYPSIGKPLSLITSKWGFLFIILVPNFFIFIYQLYSLIIRIKYDTEE